MDRAVGNGGVPEFHRQVAEQTVPDSPLRHSLANHRGAIGRAFAISALGSITYYVGITYTPAFMTSAGALSEQVSLWLSTIAAVIVILVTPFVGIASDRWGRKPVLVALGGRQRNPANDHVLADGQRIACPRTARCTRARGAGRRRQRRRRGRDRRTIPRRGPRHRPRSRRHHGHRDLRRPDALCRATAGGTDRLGDGAGRNDRDRRRLRAADLPDHEGNGARAPAVTTTSDRSKGRVRAIAPHALDVGERCARVKQALDSSSGRSR